MGRALLAMCVVAVLLAGGWLYVGERQQRAAELRAQEAERRADEEARTHQTPEVFLERLARPHGGANPWALVNSLPSDQSLRDVLSDLATRSGQVAFDGGDRLALLRAHDPRAHSAMLYKVTEREVVLGRGWTCAAPDATLDAAHFTDTAIVFSWTDAAGVARTSTIRWLPEFPAPPSGTYGPGGRVP